MALGFILGEGDWDIRQYDTASAATYLKGSLVALNTARNVVEYTSSMSAYLGIAMHSSVNSLPAGKVLVAIPKPGCIAIADVAPGLTVSSLSVGEAMAVASAATTCRMSPTTPPRCIPPC